MSSYFLTLIFIVIIGRITIEYLQLKHRFREDYHLGDADFGFDHECEV